MELDNKTEQAIVKLCKVVGITAEEAQKALEAFSRLAKSPKIKETTMYQSRGDLHDLMKEALGDDFTEIDEKHEKSIESVKGVRTAERPKGWYRNFKCAKNKFGRK